MGKIPKKKIHKKKPIDLQSWQEDDWKEIWASFSMRWVLLEITSCYIYA
jgi:hypothetical protein